MSKTKRPLAEVLPAAEMLCGLLESSCERIEVAGSLRRRCDPVGDIEIVAIPRLGMVEDRDLFDNLISAKRINHLWDTVGALGVEYSDRAKNGDKYRQFTWRGYQVDLFTADCDNWGWIFLVRTGSAEFSHQMMKLLNDRGYTSSEGRIHAWPGMEPAHDVTIAPNGLIRTPTEEDIFRLAKIGFIDPERRSW